MNNILIQNYQPMRSFYPNNNMSRNKNYSFISPNNAINHSFFQNKNIQMTQSPSLNVIFQVPKQSEISNFHFTPRTPSPFHNRRNIVDLNDNSKFKEVSNYPVFYKKFPGIDSFKQIPQPQIAQNHFRNISPQPVNLRKNNNNNFIHFVPNSLVYINMQQKIPRQSRTPEPRNNNLNIINYSKDNNNNSNSYNNINYYNENSKYNYNLLNNFQKTDTIEIDKQNFNKRIPNGHNYLKSDGHLNIIKVNDLNQNNKNENNANINASKYKQYRNIFTKKINNFYHNYQNNINIKRINVVNQNHHSLNNISFIKFNNNNQINKNNINIKKNFEIAQNHNYEYANIKKVNNLDNSSNQGPAYLNSSKGSSTALNSSTNQNIPPNIQQNHINIIPIPHNKYLSNLGENGMFRRPFKEIVISKPTPSDDFNVSEFQVLKQIGEGTFGKIYCVRWNRNNELYALKKVDLIDEELESFRKKVKIVQNLVKKTGHNGYIKVYGDKVIPQKRKNLIHYYIIMELGDKDWEREIINRKTYSLFYTEYELFQIIIQLVKSLALMQKNKVTHRDIKPQNILLCKNVFKICDFDEAKIIEGNGPILQPVRGSELYMSPILFYAYNSQVMNVLHNTYKSDVFSLGMTIFLAAALSAKPLCDIRELKDMNIISQIINSALNSRYSPNLINLIIKMLQLDENLRADFIDLEAYISNIWPS